MIRLYSHRQALQLRHILPRLALLRSQQFQGDGYDPEEHGHIIVIEEGVDLSHIPEISSDGLRLFDSDGWPLFEFVEAFVEDGHLIYEVVFQIDDSRTIVVIIPDQQWLDDVLRQQLQTALNI